MTFDDEKRAMVGDRMAVIRVVSELRESRSHNALLTADIEGWKKQAEMLRAQLAEKDAEIARLRDELTRIREEREHYRAKALGLIDGSEP